MRLRLSQSLSGPHPASPALPLARRTRLTRDNRLGLCRNVFPPIHLLPGPNKLALADRRLAEPTLLCLALPECLAGTNGRQIQTTPANP